MPLEALRVALSTWPARFAPPFAAPYIPTNATSPPPGSAVEAGRAMAAIERMRALPLQAPPAAGLSRIGLTALLPFQPMPLAGPRHNRHVPINSCVGSCGSTRNGAGADIFSPSPPTSVSVTTGVAPKVAGVQAPGCAHRWMETPSWLFTYQFEVVLGSMATGPPSPPRICCQSVVVPVTLFTPAVPIAPNPAIIVNGVLPA